MSSPPSSPEPPFAPPAPPTPPFPPLPPWNPPDSLVYFNEEWLAPISIVSFSFAAVISLYEIFLLLIVVTVARDDKPVRFAGVGFLVCLLLGALCGQGMLMAQSWQYYQVGEHHREDEDGNPLITTWLQCKLQPLLLLLHLELHAAPLSAKLWRIWIKIRRAETRQLQLWDVAGQRIALSQLLLLVILMVVHLVRAVCTRPPPTTPARPAHPRDAARRPRARPDRRPPARKTVGLLRW